MKILVASALLACALFAADVPGDAVVAIINGKKFTAEQVRRLAAGAPPQIRMVFERDPKQFLREHGFLLQLLDYAEKNGLDKKSPYRDTIEFYRLSVLANAAVNHKLASIEVSPEDQKKYYEQNQPRFREAKVRMIYVPFGDAATEEKAKAKATDIAKRARAGEDFVKLAKENSEDPNSAGADLTVRQDSSQPPEAMRKVLLNLKAGDISDPQRHDNGYYVFRVESTDVLPYEKVRDDIYKEIQNTRFNEWQQSSRSQVSVQFENEAFFQSIGKKE